MKEYILKFFVGLAFLVIVLVALLLLMLPIHFAFEKENVLWLLPYGVALWVGLVCMIYRMGKDIYDALHPHKF